MGVVRAENIQYPQVYSTFKVKVKDSEELEEFFIQDLTEEFFDRAVDFIVENHARGAVFHRAAKTLVDETGIQRVRGMYRGVFEENISLICLKSGTHEIVGLNALLVKTKENLISPLPTDHPGFKLLTEGINFVTAAFDVLGHYKIDKVILAAGLCVDSKFRGRGVATEILKARAPLVRSIGLAVTSSIFSTVGAQKAAASAGYDENYSITYEEFQKIFPKMDFSHAYGTSCKILSLKV